MAVCLLPKQETRVRFSYPAQVKILMGSTCPVVKRSFYYRGSHHPLNMKYLSSLKTKNLSGKICLLRADFNIENAELSEKNIHPRIAAVLPAINFLTKKGAKVVILSHRGRPDTTSFKFQTSDFTLKPFAKILSKLLKEPVGFVEFSKINNLTNLTKFNFVRFVRFKKDVFLLENLRFNPGEEKNDKKFAKRLAILGDFYVNEAFGVSHRKNASVEAITKFLPSYAGFSLESEIKNLSKAINPRKPLIIVLGGIKIADKIGLIKNFWNKADGFLIGGGIANTFFAAQKMPMGNSVYEKEKLIFCKKLLKSPKIILPVDVIIKNDSILDIGVKTRKNYAEIIKKAKTIIWNGPMGYIEDKKFKKGSEAILKAILESKAFSVIGGGETVALLRAQNSKFKIPRSRTSNKFLRNYTGQASSLRGRQNSKLFISTGGGAMLEFLAGKKLPGLSALE